MMETRDCPKCDGTGTLTELNAEEWDDHHRTHRPATLEHPCPICGARMDIDGDEWACGVCEKRVAFNKDKALNRLTSDAYPEHAHKPGVLMGECPVCDSNNGVNGGPDGELVCRDCNDFYAGQYSIEWYAYALWSDRFDHGIEVQE